ncbi:kinase suppressor of Ras 1 isoform X2 [Tachysurus fulvidraco]|uniref:kinase suppressor of Ras 1 isoform X2 n=1 Tax=Tachysurus fulvidraco TaxID=1234273 RepID=UPI001FEDF60A|nr:kinase suppressor of Ras 1 isoform X2 [Tachysurus fulvidraco]
MDGEEGNMVSTRDEQVEGNSADTSAIQQCQLLQNIIDITISNLQGLRTKCAASNDLTQHEIRTLEVKLAKYISKQLQCKQRVPLCERSLALSAFPHLVDWLHTINLRPEFIESVPVNLSLDALLQMSGSQVQETMRKLGSSADECSRITAALSCLKSTSTSSTSSTSSSGPWTGRELKEDGIPWIVEPARCDSPANQLSCITQSSQLYSPNPAIHVPFAPTMPGSQRSVSVSAVPSLDFPAGSHLTPLLNGLTDPFCSSPQLLRRPQGMVSTPPPTPPAIRNDLLKLPHTPPPPSKLRQLFPALPRSKSHTQLANRIEEPAHKNATKNKMLLNVHVNVQDVRNGCDDSLSRLPLLSVPSPHIIPNTRIHVESPTLKDKGRSPQAMRRDYGLTITHRFSTKSWFSQTCAVCRKNMLFGVKCKHCKLKCHNKCTKEAPQCQIIPISKIRRTESVPSDINNQVERLPSTTQFGTLPKTLNKKDLPPPVIQPDSSSNPSSTTSSTPSSPAFSSSNPPSATPPANPSPKGPNDGRFHFPASCHYQFRQQFIFPDISGSQHQDGHELGDTEQASNELIIQAVRQEENDDVDGEEDQQENERQDEAASYGESEGEDDELDDLPSCTRPWKGPISRKASQTSVYLQEWNVPFEQVELGELIGKGRWGKVYRGRWHGEVAVRLLEIDGNNQDHLKLFKKEVMNYRQTRHENVVLFMGACMNPPQLAIITSFCKGRTLHSVVRDSKSSLDINKTRQIAQEIVKGMGYLHAKDIVHKDLKSKNVFYDNNKVVITDFGLFGVSGVVQEDRRENELKLPQGWIYYLAPEIVQKMCPGNEDLLPFSKAADVYAFGTIWYELQVRDWPIKTQPAEAAIWLLGSGEGIKRQLAQISLGKEITEILCACWSFKLEDRPTFSQLADLLEKLPKLNRRLSHPGHFWKSTEYVS